MFVGTLHATLEDRSTGSIPYEDTKITKFHGIYMQDDRDLRQQRRKDGLEKAFSFMIRGSFVSFSEIMTVPVRVPGGIASCKQWLALDEIADKYANGTIKVTTRQAVQFHGVIKWNLRVCYIR